MKPTWNIPRGDSRTGRFKVILDGQELPLAGYTVAAVVRDADSPTGTLIATCEATLEPGSTSFLVTVPSTATATAEVERFFACTATPPPGRPGPFTYECEIAVSEHP